MSLECNPLCPASADTNSNVIFFNNFSFCGVFAGPEEPAKANHRHVASLQTANLIQLNSIPTCHPADANQLSAAMP